MVTVLVTGAAGFIGMHLCRRALDAGLRVIGLDDINEYYDPALKRARIGQLTNSQFRFRTCDISDYKTLESALSGAAPDVILHFAAQAGVRYSAVNPWVYERANIAGSLNILEWGRRHCPQAKFICASSSSVYSAQSRIPFREDDPCDAPVSLYGATKRSGELIADAYASAYDMAIISLRLFSVYGPWGRPDMAYWLFAEALLADQPLHIYDDGAGMRDFTYIDDVVECVLRFSQRHANFGRHDVFNIGHSEPHSVLAMVRLLEKTLGKSGDLRFEGPQPGELRTTYASIEKLRMAINFAPRIGIEQGLQKFCDWFVEWRNGRDLPIRAITPK